MLFRNAAVAQRFLLFRRPLDFALELTGRPTRGVESESAIGVEELTPGVGSRRPPLADPSASGSTVEPN